MSCGQAGWLSSYIIAAKLTCSSIPEETSPFRDIQTPQTSSSVWQNPQCLDPSCEIVPWMTVPGRGMKLLVIDASYMGLYGIFLGATSHVGGERF